MMRAFAGSLFGLTLLSGCHSEPAAPPEPFVVSGKVTLCRSGHPIHQAVITLRAADTTLTTTSDASGLFTISAVPTGNYTLSTARVGTTADDPAILGSDALAVAAAATTGTALMTPCELDAADVDQDGEITLADWVAIERFILEIRDDSIGSVGEWIFSEPVTNISSDTEVDIIGILVGDVDASWPNSNPM